MNDLKAKYNIRYFTDNDRTKWNTSFCGILVIEPEKVKHMKNITTVIASTYFKEIAKQLDQLEVYDYKIYNLEKNGISFVNLFSNKFYYEKKLKDNNKLVENYKLSNIIVQNILFLQTTSFMNTISLAQVLKNNNLNLDILLLNEEIGVEDIKKLDIFNNIFTLNEFDEKQYYKYDVIHNSNENHCLTTKLKQLNLPIVNYMDQEMYLKENIFFDSYVLDIVDEKLNQIDYMLTDNISEINTLETYNLENSVGLSINYDITNKSLANYCINKLSKSDKEIHCVYIGKLEDDKNSCYYLLDKFLELTKVNIHVHIYTKELSNYCKLISKQSRYLHIEPIHDEFKIIEEITQYDIGLIFYNLNERNEFYISNIIPSVIWKYISAGLPIAIENITVLKDFVKEGNIGNVFDFNENIKSQLVEIAKIKYNNQVFINDRKLDKGYTELMNFYKLINYYHNNLNESKDISVQLNEIITVLIPTKNRPNFLKRIVSYLCLMNIEKLSFKIYILDSSDEKIKKINEDTIERFNSENNIFHYEYDTEIAFMEKVLDGLNKTTTEMCFISSDDDFCSKKGISASFKLISEEKEFITVSGDLTWFCGDTLDFIINKMDDFNLLHNNDNENRVERLNSFLKHRVQLFYGIFRVKYLKHIFKSLLNNRSSYYSINTSLQEDLYYFIQILNYKFGKINNSIIITITHKNSYQNFTTNYYDSILNKNLNNECKTCQDILNNIFDNGTVDVFEFLEVLFKYYYKIDEASLCVENEGFNLDLLQKWFDKNNPYSNFLKYKKK